MVYTFFLPRSLGKISRIELCAILNQSISASRNMGYTGLDQQPVLTTQLSCNQSPKSCD